MDQEKQKLTQSWEVLKQWQWWLSWFGIFAGSTVLAAGFVFFINPYNIVPGGVYGASIVLHNLFPSIQVGTFGYMFDIPLLIVIRGQIGCPYDGGSPHHPGHYELDVEMGLSDPSGLGGIGSDPTVRWLYRHDATSDVDLHHRCRFDWHRKWYRSSQRSHDRW